MTVVPSDTVARLRALTDHGSTLLVEAAAGTGKTALLAGRITMLLAEGCAPGHIAAITFMEAAAGDLSERVHRYVAELLVGDIPRPLLDALPSGLTPLQNERLRAASAALHELTASTIHGFCQSILCTYAIEADIDPGARVVDATHANIVFGTVFDRWFRRRLSVPLESTDPIAILAREDPKHVLTTVRQLAQFRRRYRTARPIAADLSGRPDVALVEAVREFRSWSEHSPKIKETEELLTDLEALVGHYTDSFSSTPDFAHLWRLAHPPPLNVMRSDESFELKLPRMKQAWQRASGKERGAKLNDEAMQCFGRVDIAYRTLLGKVATALIAALSEDVDDVLEDFAQFKRAAALLDFDDLLYRTRDLVVNHDEVRLALGRRYSRILVDEFQDTDPLQAEILFRIGADVAPARWDEASLRPGSLYLVGDPKQAIFAFRGADIESYVRAKRVIGPERHIHVTANFRSRPGILSHVNRCFEGPLSAAEQPGYIEITSTRAPIQGGPPSVTKLTVQLAEYLQQARSNDIRDAEAKAVADLCALLVGNVHVDDDGNQRPLRASDIALLTPADTQLWRYEQALDDRGLPYVSLAGKNLLDRQEVRDMLALARVLADAEDTLAFGALMRGPLIGLSEQELLDITQQLPPVPERPNDIPRFSLRTDPAHVAHPVARESLMVLRQLRRISFSTTPQLVLSEAVERMSIRSILSIRDGDRSNRALANIDSFLELARAYDVRGLKQFVADLMKDWIEEVPHDEGRVDAFGDAVQIVTMHSSKGLEWPVVIPINTVTWRRKPDQFVYRPSDDTMHWVLKDVVPPDLHAVLQAKDAKDARERERLYYVAFTRAKDLLILPKLPTSDERAWSSTISDPHLDVPEIDLSGYALKTFQAAPAEKNEQTPQLFAQQLEAVRASSRKIVWIRPSQDDLDRVPVTDVIAAQDDDPAELAFVAGAGRIRGLLLHKLIEEVLTGETTAEHPALTARAVILTRQLSQGRELLNGPEPAELAATVERTLSIPELAALRSGLIPEIGVFGSLLPDEGEFVSGRIDAVYIEKDKPQIALDWKSDVDPSESDIEIHSAQLRAYMCTIEIPRGLLVYMSTSRLYWLDAKPKQHS